MQVFAATKNEGKLRELQAIFAPLGWTIESDSAYVDPPEAEESYAENAALKARALFAQRHERGAAGPVLGDDSGIEVAALEGRPGVLSARYGGPDLDWRGRRMLMLREIAESGSADRSARFVCSLHFIGEDGVELAVQRDLSGAVAPAERGDGGFSYDALFEHPAGGPTFGEIPEEEKNAISHRARAARSLHEAWRALRASGVRSAGLE